MIYVIVRLDSEISKYITLKRRKVKKFLSNNNLSSKKLLDQLNNLYETLLLIIYKKNRYALNYLKQEIK